jgi:hypothetical protein
MSTSSNPEVCSLISDMPFLIHEIFTASVFAEIVSHIQQITKDPSRPDVAALARKICYSSAGDIQLNSLASDNSSSPRSPDASFRYINSKYPCVIIETSFSQKKRDSAYRADDYITDSYCNIKLVIGFDIEYSRSKRATVSVWQPKLNFEEDGTPYFSAEKIVNSKVRRLIVASWYRYTDI